MSNLRNTTDEEGRVQLASD